MSSSTSYRNDGADNNQSWDEHQEAILRTVSYHQRRFASYLISFPGADLPNMYDSLSKSFSRVAKTGLGGFDRMPLEVLHDVLLHLDMRAILTFRHLNVRSRQIIDTIKQYPLAVKNGLTAMCALLRTGLAVRVSLSDFFEVLCTEACTLCKSFGGFVFLPTWTRCCYQCIESNPGFALHSLDKLRIDFKSNLAAVNLLPSFKTLRGRYGPGRCVSESGLVLSHLPDALRLREHERQLYCETRGLRFMGSCELPFLDKATQQIERGVSCAGCHYALERRSVNNGNDDILFLAQQKVYLPSQFLEHFEQCEDAQHLWNQSDQGTLVPPDMPAYVLTNRSLSPDG